MLWGPNDVVQQARPEGYPLHSDEGWCSMTNRKIKELSKVDFSTEHWTYEAIGCSALIRIADATEKMAIRYTELIDRAERLKKSCDYFQTKSDRAERRISALKGQITKLKKKGAV